MIKNIKITEDNNGCFGVVAMVDKDSGEEQYFMARYFYYDGLDRNRQLEFFKKQVILYATDKNYDQYSVIIIEG
ncbi:MAG: hypothetical protein GX913_08795 [Clostridiales bacterium]|nr:hypothetical protein [Clostridiales bacterium]